MSRGPVPPLHAGAGDRWGDRVLTAGPIAFEQNAQKIQIAQDAVYYLNYSQGLLLATVPSTRSMGTSTQVLNDFAVRDLMKDFQLGPGTRPHFLMTVGTLGAREGWAPLYVFETETGQVAVYRLTPQATAGSTRPVFELLERKVDPRLGRGIQTAAQDRG
jgi:hypothetical protein